MRNEWNYAWTEREKEGREEASGGEREQRREVEGQLREDRRRKGDRETRHNTALALETLVLQIKSSEPV